MKEIVRKEIKYIIPIEKFAHLRKKLELLMEKDTYGIEGKYTVRTQYFDSVRDDDLFDNLDGVMEKRKIRIRTYSLDSSTAKLEYKCKSNTDVRKLSLLISREEAIGMENGQYEFLLKREEDLARFLFAKMSKNGYLPKTIVEYERMAYKYSVSDLRITFDTSIKGTVNPYGLFHRRSALIPLLNHDIGILEIKYNNFIASPFTKIIQEIDQVVEASSKYSISRLLI